MGIVVNDASEAEAIYEQCFVEALEFSSHRDDDRWPGVDGRRATRLGNLKPYSLTENWQGGARPCWMQQIPSRTIGAWRRYGPRPRECPALNGYST